MVLGLISQGYRYGHELDKVIEERNMRLWSKLTRVAMYKALTRIREKGWVKANTEKEGKQPERIVYTLTESGKEALKSLVAEELASNELMEFHISIPVSFLYILPPAEVIIHLEKRKKFLVQLLERISLIEDIDNCNVWGKRANGKLIHGYYRLEVQWLEWLISELNGKPTSASDDEEGKWSL